MTFAAITAALVLGSVVERMKFSAVMAFVAVWLTIVYFPIAHMVWASSGLFFKAGALDFAGGTVVHINAGVSALVASLILGKRMGYPTTPMPPHSPTNLRRVRVSRSRSSAVPRHSCTARQTPGWKRWGAPR